ncbi:MAG: zinc-ribbon domain-containing protein, partial [Candidatus Lokiarchaeota archaeon]|nr:zinc-ribbon domain-containing protein [Candidatus Lokiarchaeota archaeon]
KGLLNQLGPMPPPGSKAPKPQPKLVNIEAGQKTQDTCPECGTRVNLTESKFCPECGHEMKNLSIDIPTTKVERYPEKCQACGKKLKEQSKFCPYCGAEIQLILEEIPTESQQSDTSASIPEFSVDASEFADDSADESTGIINIIAHKNRDTAIFNGASILGALSDFKKLFVTHEEFSKDPNCIEVEFSKVL